MEPMIGPELTRLAIAKPPDCGCTEQLLRLGLTGEGEVSLGTARIGGLQPHPLGAKSDAGTQKFVDPKTSQAQGADKPWPN